MDIGEAGWIATRCMQLVIDNSTDEQLREAGVMFNHAQIDEAIDRLVQTASALGLIGVALD